jgi:hypothetical protein
VKTYDPMVNGSFPDFSSSDNADGPSAKYLRNATSTFMDLQFGGGSLMSVQAILGMVR